MADILSSLLSFPPEKKVGAKEWDRQATEFASQLSKASTSAFTKTIDKSNILDLLNPSVNSLPYLFAILAQIQAAGKNQTRLEDVVTRTVMFFTSFDPIQVRYAGSAFRELLEWGFDMYPKLGIRDFTPLTTAMLRLDPTAGTFTSTHLHLVRCCLATSSPSQALPVLDKNIYAFPQTQPKGVPDELLSESQELSNSFINTQTGLTVSPLKSEWILEYYLSGAIIYIGLRDFSRARLFLEYCLLMPSSQHAASVLQMEAYKKWVLIGLLAQGKSYPIPRTYDAQVMKSLRSTSRAYEALADAFEKRDWRKYQAEMDTGVQIWHEDGNTRLVREAADALLRYRVIDLQKTFAALPVSRVAQHVELQEKATLQMLDDIIRQGYLNGSITSSPAGAVLTFNATSSPSEVQDLDLEAQTARIDALVTFIRDADRRLQLTKEFVEYQKRSKRGAAAGPDGDLADQMDLSWDAPIVIDDDEGEDGDEDIMAA